MELKQSAFQTPVTIVDAINAVHSNQYLLPAIQREFVWKPEQIIMLFDSLLRGYPIGSFLFWDVEQERIKDYQFYDFIRDFHERDNRHNPKASVTEGKNITVILDGQQRLTALYIGLRGTYAYKIPHRRWESSEAFPKRKLYLNLLSRAEESEIDLYYDIAFLTPEEGSYRENDIYWFEIGKILNLKDESEVNDYLVENGIMALEKEKAKFANKTLFKLHSVVNKDRIINYYLERSQELGKVLNIFIRVNSGGTILSYSDLLLSVATAQWKTKDAREEVTSFVDEINNIGEGFDFDKDFVLKSCLVISDISSIAFRVENFSNENMLIIERNWDDIEKALRLTVELISSFGYSKPTLTSANALIPIAYYIMKIGLPENFILSSKYSEDRQKIRKWLATSLIKRIFSGQPDNVLGPIRTILKQSAQNFPMDHIVDRFKGTNKSFVFTDDDIENFFFTKYGQGHTYAILSLLYPTLDTRNRFHVDHIFPKSWFKRKVFVDKKIPQDQQGFYLTNVDLMPNLQLLEGVPNEEKSNKDFGVWLRETSRDDAELLDCKKKNYIPQDIELEFMN
ncbi:DUF262 domain-containing protein, partial [bacterium]